MHSIALILYENFLLKKVIEKEKILANVYTFFNGIQRIVMFVYP